jgi:hypothetical protein
VPVFLGDHHRIVISDVRTALILGPVTTSLAVARQTWHAVAELVLAGPQLRRSDTIRLRVVPGGFATVSEPALEVVGDSLHYRDGSVPIDGRSCQDLARTAGVEAGAPGIYRDGTDADPATPLRLDAAAASALGDAFGLGDASLRAFAPSQSPVLWPEHFDVSVTLDEVNYGVSPGDGYLGEPYAYVGPWQRRAGAFWNAPFGAARPLAQLSDVDSVVAFFERGRRA